MARGPVAQLGARFHGMEEVVGSIPTRSTKSLNMLERASIHGQRVCVVVCVITRPFGAYGQNFKGSPLCFHSHMAVTFQHVTADVAPDVHTDVTLVLS